MYLGYGTHGHAKSQCLVQHAVVRRDTQSAPGLERKIFQQEKNKTKKMIKNTKKALNFLQLKSNLRQKKRKKSSKLRQLSSKSSSDRHKRRHTKNIFYKNKSLMVNPTLRSPRSQGKKHYYNRTILYKT